MKRGQALLAGFSAFPSAFRAAREASCKIAQLDAVLHACGCEEFTDRMVAIARARSRTGGRSAGSFIDDMASEIAWGRPPAQVLRDFAPEEG